MSQGKVDEAIWFESLLAPQREPAPEPLLPEPEPRRWKRFLRQVTAPASAPGR